MRVEDSRSCVNDETGDPQERLRCRYGSDHDQRQSTLGWTLRLTPYSVKTVHSGLEPGSSNDRDTDATPWMFVRGSSLATCPRPDTAG